MNWIVSSSGELDSRAQFSRICGQLLSLPECSTGRFVQEISLKIF